VTFALTLLILALMIGLFDMFVPPRATWARALVEKYAARQAAPVPASGAPPAGVLTEDLVRSRLRAVSAELAHLDRDRSRFALAFRTRVARDAYRALQDDALRLAQRRARTLDVTGGSGVVEVGTPTGRGRREELEL